MTPFFSKLGFGRLASFARKRADAGVRGHIFLLALSFFAGSIQHAWSQVLLSADHFRSGSRVLRAFTPVVEKVRDSVVSIRVDGKLVAFGTVVDANGLVITKASEIGSGDLMCRLANGTDAKARILKSDDENDVALLKVEAEGLKPIRWVTRSPAVGQWLVTPGVNEKPEAIGILSVPERKILHKRALIGVEPDFTSRPARIARVMQGLGAEKAGLKAGDVIMAVNDQLVNGAEELVETLRKYRAGQTVVLRVKRGEEEITANVLMMLPPPPENGLRRFEREDRVNRLGGDVSERAEGFDYAIQHDSVLAPWQCGGPLVDLDGNAVGINIARAARIASYALPASLVKEILEKLKQEASDRL